MWPRLYSKTTAVFRMPCSYCWRCGSEARDNSQGKISAKWPFKEGKCHHGRILGCNLRLNQWSQQTLQKETIELQSATDLLKSLFNFLPSQRENAWWLQEESKWENWLFINRLIDSGDVEEVAEFVLWGKEKFKIETYLSILDKLYAEHSCHMEAYSKIYGSLLSSHWRQMPKLKKLPKNSERITLRVGVYRWNQSFQVFHITENINGDEIVPALWSYKLIFENMMQSVFPNVITALRIYKYLMIQTLLVSEPFWN